MMYNKAVLALLFCSAVAHSGGSDHGKSNDKDKIKDKNVHYADRSIVNMSRSDKGKLQIKIVKEGKVRVHDTRSGFERYIIAPIRNLFGARHPHPYAVHRFHLQKEKKIKSAKSMLNDLQEMTMGPKFCKKVNELNKLLLEIDRNSTGVDNPSCINYTNMKHTVLVHPQRRQRQRRRGFLGRLFRRNKTYYRYDQSYHQPKAVSHKDSYGHPGKRTTGTGRIYDDHSSQSYKVEIKSTGGDGHSHKLGKKEKKIRSTHPEGHKRHPYKSEKVKSTHHYSNGHQTYKVKVKSTRHNSHAGHSYKEKRKTKSIRYGSHDHHKAAKRTKAAYHDEHRDKHEIKHKTHHHAKIDNKHHHYNSPVIKKKTCGDNRYGTGSYQIHSKHKISFRGGHKKHTESKSQKHHKSHKPHKHHKSYKVHKTHKHHESHKPHKHHKSHKPHKHHKSYKVHKTQKHHESHKPHKHYKSHKPHKHHKSHKDHKVYKHHKACKSHKTHKPHKHHKSHKVYKTHKSHKSHKDHKVHKHHKACKSHKTHKHHKSHKNHKVHKAHKAHKYHKSHKTHKPYKQHKDHKVESKKFGSLVLGYRKFESGIKGMCERMLNLVRRYKHSNRQIKKGSDSKCKSRSKNLHKSKHTYKSKTTHKFKTTHKSKHTYKTKTSHKPKHGHCNRLEPGSPLSHKLMKYLRTRPERCGSQHEKSKGCHWAKIKHGKNKHGHKGGKRHSTVRWYKTKKNNKGYCVHVTRRREIVTQREVLNRKHRNN